jgi:hypothetical protein
MAAQGHFSPLPLRATSDRKGGERGSVLGAGGSSLARIAFSGSSRGASGKHIVDRLAQVPGQRGGVVSSVNPGEMVSATDTGKNGAVFDGEVKKVI